MSKDKNKRLNLFNRSMEEISNAFNTYTKKELEYEVDHLMDRDFQSEDEKRNSKPRLKLEQDHKKPVTRRDFISRGFKAGGVALLAPNMIYALRAQGADCTNAGPADPNALNHIPFLTIDGAGGLSLSGDNFIVGQNNNPNNFLNSYEQMGVPNNQHPDQVGIISPFGMNMHPNSQVAAGITSRASAAALANVSGSVICVESDDDTGNNPFNISNALARSGTIGEFAGVIGTDNSETGGNSDGILVDAAYQSTRVRTAEDAAELNQAGRLAQNLNNQQSTRVIASVARITEAQINKVNAQVLNQQQKDSVSCGAIQNQQVLGGAAVDILGDANVQDLFPAAGQNFSTRNNVDPAVATAVKLAIEGKVGPTTVEISGCDYHGDGRPDQDSKDRQVGAAIGAAIEYAHRNQSPLFINLISDGSTASGSRDVGDNSNLFEQNSDNGRMGVNIMLFYNPAGRVDVSSPQLGSYSDRGVVNGEHPWSNNPEISARVVLANILFLDGKLNVFNQLFPQPGFNLANAIVFANGIR